LSEIEASGVKLDEIKESGAKFGEIGRN